MKTILFADNDEETAEKYRVILEQEGYRVVTAGTPEEATRCLQQGGIDLAVLDLRLVDDEDEHDTSGLDVASEVARDIPKILFSDYGSIKEVSAALGLRLEGLPPALAFVKKDVGPTGLLAAIQAALRIGARYRELTTNLVDSIRKDYEDAREQARRSFNTSGVMAGFAIFLIFGGAAAAMMGTAVNALSSVAGVIASGVSILFIKRSNDANARVDQYHRELLDTRQLETLLAACDDLDSPRKRDDCKEGVVTVAAQSWFGSGRSVRQAALRHPRRPAPKRRARQTPGDSDSGGSEG